MRTATFLTLFLTAPFLSCDWAAEKNAASEKFSAFSVPATEKTPEAIKFSDAQIARVQGWVREKIPECPADIYGAVAQQFLEELQRVSPDKIDSLLLADFSARDFESMLLRTVATKLTAPEYAGIREEIARRRVVVVSALAGLPASKDVAGTIEKIRDASSSQYRRLVEGRMDDDDLQLVLKKASQTGMGKKEWVTDKPKVLSASDIVAEFARRNQTGSALQHLQSYVVEGRIKTSDGNQQELLLFHMRPDYFKLVVRSNGLTRYILAGKAGRYWQSSKDTAPQGVPEQALGEKRHLADFTDPLFVGEGFAFERLEDGIQDEKKVYRIDVRRADGSTFVARIEMETFHEVGSEKPDHSLVRYSDFREVGGVNYAFREEVTDASGRKGTFELNRLTPNLGLIGDFFEPPAHPELGYYELEAAMSPSSAPALKIN